jgi:uncharacterized membrane protein
MGREPDQVETALAALSLAVLIFFIHHVATSIRIETVLADLADETRPQSIDSTPTK